MTIAYSVTATGGASYTIPAAPPYVISGAGFATASGPQTSFTIVSLNDRYQFRFAGFDNANGALYTGLSATIGAFHSPNLPSPADFVGQSYFLSESGAFYNTTQTLVADPNGSNLVNGLPACYAAGTRILTSRGEVAVEKLRPGDMLVTATGDAPVIWTGQRGINCARLSQDAWPIRIQAGAFGRGLPTRDLRLSPDHAIFDDGLLIPIRHLVNGATITREACERITYWHVELERHDVILAEGLPAESYLDTGNRGAFERQGVVRLQGDIRGDADVRRCAPTVTDHAQLHGIRARLRGFATRLGHVLSGDPAPRLLADGVELVPAIEGRTRRYPLPAGVAQLRLCSRHAVPAELLDGVPDPRRLGLGVCRIELDGAAVSLGNPCLTDGWHAPERHGDDQIAFRWTDGDAGLRLPDGGLLEIELGGDMLYWVEAQAAPAQNRAA